MSTKTQLLGAVLCLAAFAGMRTGAADDIGVYVGNPGIAHYIEDAEHLRHELPGARARWDAVAARGGTYTLRVLPGDGHDPSLHCPAAPITVQVKQGRMTSATYAASMGTCTAGASVTAAENPTVFSLLSPEALFDHLASLVDRGVAGQACVEAILDSDYGLPTSLEEGCPWLQDTKVRVQISDIIGVQQHFWYLVGSFAAALLGLLALAYYHFKRDRRRLEKMPELLLR